MISQYFVQQILKWIKKHATVIASITSALTFIIIISQLLVGTYYKDSDQDGFGDPDNYTFGIWKPKGYVKNNSDCYDGNKLANPNQTKFFATDRGDDSFDYNCDGEPTREFVDTGECDGWHEAKQGWDGPAPECGKEGSWLYDCDYKPLKNLKGPIRETRGKTQRCQ